MCGIAGIIDTTRAPDEAAICAMIKCMPYRGPDGTGHICIDEHGVALGHLRLSIIDLSDAARQPMLSASGRLWITYNGEIYNYLEIRAELESLGWTFRSGSDTEVLLCAYEQWGAACLERCMGMYAFAIWDRERRELFAARDRLGIKPFYFLETAGGLVFASEIKSILAARAADHCVDTSLLDAYMSFGYVPGEETLHKGIHRLRPGHSLTWRDNRTSMRSYWDLQFAPQQNQDLSASVAETKRLLQQSIALHLRSDVPLGVFLSGGIDSSAVVALLARNVSNGLNTFSVAFDFGSQFDESQYAREVASHFSTRHHEIRVTAKQFGDFVPRYIWHMDEPVTEAAAIALYYVSKLARERVTVCLSGEGSDELYAGYDFFRYNLAIERVQELLGTRVCAQLTGIAAKWIRLSKLRKYLELAGKPFESRYRGIATYEDNKKQRLYSDALAASAARGNDNCKTFIESLFARSRGWDPLSRMLYFDTKTWLVDDLLIKADRMSMATSIELRVPFLDHRLVERAAAMPPGHKLRRGETKCVLKRALRGLLPDRIVRRRKMGFPIPLELMFRGDLFDYASDLLLSRRALERGYFKGSEVERLLKQHRTGGAAHHREIWQLLVLEEWHRSFGY